MRYVTQRTYSEGSGQPVLPGNLQIHGLYHRGSQASAHRHRERLERVRARPLQPASGRAARQGRHLPRRRHAHRVRRHRRLRRHGSGPRRHALHHALARADRQLHRVHGADQPVRRSRPARLVRQDRSGHADGGGPSGHPVHLPAGRPDGGRRRVRRPSGRPDLCHRGLWYAFRRKDHGGGVCGAGGYRLPGLRLVLLPRHREHHVRPRGSARHDPAGRRHRPGDLRRSHDEGRGDRRQDHGAGREEHHRPPDHHRRLHPQRHQGMSGHERLDQRRHAPDRHRLRG